MSRQLNPSQVWSQVPVANRLIEVNTKTGFSLTAGSYSVRASSTQSGVVSFNGATSGNATISSVTLTRANAFGTGCGTNAASDLRAALAYLTLTSATTVTGNTNINSGEARVGYSVLELF